MTQLARLKPYNERKGYLTRIYSIDSQRFLSEKGWYEVSDTLAEKLKDLHQDHYNEESPLLFDVASEEEAEKIDQKETETEVAARATARSPQKLRTRQSTQVWPANNAGGVAGLPTGTGDLTTVDLTAGRVLDTPGIDHQDEDEFHTDLGRTGEPKTRKKHGTK